MFEASIYPWQREVWQHWQHYMMQATVPHAMLLHGRSGWGSDDFALRLCCSLLCDSNNNDKPCRICQGCRLFLSGNHPDCLIVEAERGRIKIEQVRKAIDFLQLSRHYLHYKIVLFKEVDHLNYAAANSLLKTLEEPPSAAMIVMTCRQPSTLLPTIRSRCHHIYLKEIVAESVTWLAERLSISETQAKQRLLLFDNAPLALLNENSNKNKLSFYKELEECLAQKITIHDFVDHWCEQSATEVQKWLLIYLQNLITEKAEKVSNNQMDTGIIKSNLANLLYSLYPRQIERCRLAEQNINPRLLLEASLYDWRRTILGK